MTNQGSRAFYRITNAINDHFKNSDIINTITYGDITEVDLNKQTIFPLAHVMVNNASLDNSTIVFNVSVIVMDIVHVNKNSFEDLENVTYGDYDTFKGNDNEQDVLNIMLYVVNRLNQFMSRGNLRRDGFELQTQGTCEPFTDRFENKLAGWVYTFNVYVRNDINICEQ